MNESIDGNHTTQTQYASKQANSLVKNFFHRWFCFGRCSPFERLTTMVSCGMEFGSLEIIRSDSLALCTAATDIGFGW
jgi:hypothetical protein